MRSVADNDLSERGLWRRQCVRNVMDCYAAGMEALTWTWGEGKKGQESVEALTRLMVEGMTEEGRGKRGERDFYRKAALLCRESAAVCERTGGEAGKKAGLFRIYGAIFEDLSGKEG